MPVVLVKGPTATATRCHGLHFCSEKIRPQWGLNPQTSSAYTYELQRYTVFKNNN